MFKIAICDDTPDDLDLSLSLINQYIQENDIQAQITAFDHPDKLLSQCETFVFDLYILDIVMPMVSGIDVGKEIKKININAKIIYLTSSDEFAVEAFSVQAVHYLVKPVQKSALDSALKAAFSLIDENACRLSVKTESGSIAQVDVKDILYIESVSHTQKIHTKFRTLTEYKRSLSRIYEELEKTCPGQFILPYKGYIVNLQAVRGLNTTQITLKNGVTLPVASRSFKQVKDAYFDFLFSSGSFGNQ